MLKSIPVFVFLLLVKFSFAQTAIVPETFNFEKAELKAHLMYLASDELGGRRTTSPGGALAAEYIASTLESYGVKPAPDLNSYFQQIPFNDVKPPVSGSLKLGKTEFTVNENMLILKGAKSTFTAQTVFAGHGWVDESAGVDDYKNLDVKGKIVFVLPGKPDAQSPMQVFQAMKEKQRFAEERGASALFELYRLNFPWQFFKNYFGKARLEMGEDEEEITSQMVYGWVQEGAPNPIPELENGTAMQAEFSTSGISVERLEAANVVGMIEGTDDELKSEYLVLSAHYDHVGIGKQGGAPFTAQDSIFNGARDNGMGIVALLAAAKSLSANPPKRSVILLACTGEEMGMLGSAWFADHPVVPLEQMVFNLNNDGAGYNSTKHITVIGLKRTNVDKQLEKGAEATGLELTDDPAPEQNLYERSDNISFALKGIPAIDIAPGITAMDETIFRYYHQATDNPDSVDFDYLLRFSQAYTAMARLIADREGQPAWMPGDKFEKK